MWIFLPSGRRALQESDRKSEFRCTVCGIGMDDIVTTHGTCGEMSDGADSADSDRRSSIIGRTMLHRACMTF